MALSRTLLKAFMLFMVLLTVYVVTKTDLTKFQKSSLERPYAFDWNIYSKFPYEGISTNYVIKPLVKCEGVEFVLSVLSRRSDQITRHAIRKTWGSYAHVPSNNATLIFLLGSEHPSTNRSDTVQTMIDQEAKLFGDILQEDYIDSYYNLTLKSVSILRWVSLHCPDSKFLLKSDDDMYINVPLLHQTLKEMSNSKTASSAFVVGHVLSTTQPIRDTSSKWYVSTSMYNKTVFPVYTSGPAYAMSTEAAKLLYKISLNMTYLFLEDVFITGICAEAANVTRVNDDRFLSLKREPSGCMFRKNLAGEQLTPTEIMRIHREMNDTSIKCTK